MTGVQRFLPKRTPGLIFHAALIILVLAGVSFLLWMAFGQPGGISLILYLAGAFLLLATLPFLAYRGYALLHAYYELERDGLRIRWGLRSLDIPITEVEWVRPPEDLLIPLKLPGLSTPGAILGEGNHEDLGKIEFIASSMENLVIVATMNQVVILSPEDKDEFIRRFNRTIEMGSLSPIEPHSARPAVFLRQITTDKLARVLIPLGFGLWFSLLVIVSVVIPGRSAISLGYDPNGLPLEAVPASRMLMLPILGILLYLVSLVGGAYIFRKHTTRPVSYFLWAGGVLAPFLLILATILFLL
jgi:hypothetical protein